MTRVETLKQFAASNKKLQNIAIFNQANLIYFTNFSGATALLITENGENILYVSSVNYQQAKEEASNVTVELLKNGENLNEKIAKHCLTSRLGVDSVSFESWQALAKAIGRRNRIEIINPLIIEMRKLKDPQEIKFIRKACEIASTGAKTAKEIIHPGIKEKEVAAEVEYAMRKVGSDGLAFQTIVASGSGSAYPHGNVFMEKTIRNGDLVLVDLGATWKFYHSDITRTFVAGHPSEKQKIIFESVKNAQQKAIDLIAPNVLAREVDSTARLAFEKTGYASFFVHNLGHGVGLEVHEMPILGPKSQDSLETGNVLTVEPGIYFPNFGGVRIEDTVLVTRNGAEKLTTAPYALTSE